jgi:hypothetical protein
VLWLREMTPAQIREVGQTRPTFDKIDVAAFEALSALKAKAPAFRQ